MIKNDINAKLNLLFTQKNFNKMAISIYNFNIVTKL